MSLYISKQPENVFSRETNGAYLFIFLNYIIILKIGGGQLFSRGYILHSCSPLFLISICSKTTVFLVNGFLIDTAL